MRLFSCYHPKLVKNKYTGELVLARCGSCPACLNARSANWVQRLDEEIRTSKFTFFSTLQYDEQHVPQLVLLRHCDNPNNLPSYMDADTGQIVSLSDVSDFTPADINYCNDTKVLPVVSVRDIQLLNKRLRKIISKKYNNERIRYYIAAEYGPTTFRPHYHCLYFINSTLLAKDFARLLSTCWTNGNVFDTHSISGSAAQYVASYVNCFANLPKIYLHKAIRPRAIFSKRPPIGFNQFDEETFKRFLDSGTLSFTLFQQNVSQFSDVPLWRTMQNRLYPRITAFDRLSHYDRTLLYSKGLCTAYRNKWFKGIIVKLKSFYWRPYFNVAFLHKDKITHLTSINYGALARFCNTVRRFADNLSLFNLSLDDYLCKIENYYEKKIFNDFKEWYALQDEYFKEHPLSDFLCMCPNFPIECNGKMFSELTPAKQFYLQYYFGRVFAPSERINIKLTDCFAYRELVSMHQKITFSNTKQKKSNDYLLAHKDKFSNIITYNQEINDYVKK